VAAGWFSTRVWMLFASQLLLRMQAAAGRPARCQASRREALAALRIGGPAWYAGRGRARRFFAISTQRPSIVGEQVLVGLRFDGCRRGYCKLRSAAGCTADGRYLDVMQRSPSERE